jgi:PiT family inorganic phosphate transporter
MPISTTHAAASSIVGAGIGSGKGVNWHIVGRMLLTWLITIPAASFIGFSMFHVTQLPVALAWIAVGTVILGFGVWAIWAMLHTIHASDVEAELPPESVLAEPLPMSPRLVAPEPTTTNDDHTPIAG